MPFNLIRLQSALKQVEKLPIQQFCLGIIYATPYLKFESIYQDLTHEVRINTFPTDRKEQLSRPRGNFLNRDDKKTILYPTYVRTTLPITELILIGVWRNFIPNICRYFRRRLETRAISERFRRSGIRIRSSRRSRRSAAQFFHPEGYRVDRGERIVLVLR